MQASAGIGGKTPELLGDRLACHRQIRRDLPRDATDLEASAEVYGGDLGQQGGDAEGHPGAALPDLGIAAGPDVGVKEADAQPVVALQCLDLVELGVPDAETCGRAADVCAVAVAGTESRVEAHADFAAGKAAPETGELVQGTGV